MPPMGSSPSFSTASNCAMRALEDNLGLEYRHGLAADPDAGERGVAEFELDLDPAGAVQGVPLDADEASALGLAAEEPEMRQVGPEQPVRVAAHRILGDAECRAEHA